MVHSTSRRLELKARPGPRIDRKLEGKKGPTRLERNACVSEVKKRQSIENLAGSGPSTGGESHLSFVVRLIMSSDDDRNAPNPRRQRSDATELARQGPGGAHHLYVRDGGAFGMSRLFFFFKQSSNWGFDALAADLREALVTNAPQHGRRPPMLDLRIMPEPWASTTSDRPTHQQSSMRKVGLASQSERMKCLVEID